MSTKCSLPTCVRQSHALCHGCQSNFCREHMFEHSISTHLQLNPLIDQTNQLNDDLKELNTKDSLRISHEELKEWRRKSHQLVDNYFEKKIRDLDIYIEKKFQQYQQDLQDIQKKIAIYKREKETTHEQINALSYQIENLQRNVNKIKLNDVHMQVNPLVIDRDLINFERFFHASALPPIYRIIDRKEKSFTPLATNKELLLLHYEGTLLLVDRELTTFKQTPWTYGPIYDMCYSSVLDRFIIINENEVFLFNEDNLNIEKVRSIPWQRWFSCTCSDTSLYLSTKVYSSSLIEYRLLPTIEFFQKWPSSVICTENEAIDGIVYNNNTLALMIRNEIDRVVRFELRSTVTYGQIWSLRLDIVYNEKRAFRFCLINANEWLVADHNNARLLHISADGKMKTAGAYQPIPSCTIEFGNDMLVVSTKSVVNLHKL